MVLIVDDEVCIAEHIGEFLKDESISAVLSSDSTQVMQMLEQRRFRCVITDIAMPKLNGIELSEMVRKRFPHIKIVCVSGYSDIMLPELERLQVDHFVQKPYRIEELIEIVKACLKAA